jgi:hypothetical protein
MFCSLIMSILPSHISVEEASGFVGHSQDQCFEEAD